MKRFMQLAVAALALAAVMTPSSFAETRPQQRTERDQSWREGDARVQRDRPNTQREQARRERGDRPDGERSTNMRRVDDNGVEVTVQGSRTDARDRRSEPRAAGRSGNERNRYEGRQVQRDSRDRRPADSRSVQRRDYERRAPAYGSGGRHSQGRQPYYANGRVSRVQRHGEGYRVWVAGAPHPFFVPRSHYRRDRFRVGVVIRIGGYYNPRGYYDYYDGRSSGVLRGVVESVDYRRETFVVRNDATGSFVTVLLRRGRFDVRPGDYVDLYGDWSRHGLFEARQIDYLDYRYR